MPEGNGSGMLMKRISIKGVLIGGIVDVGSTMLLGLSTAIYAAFVVNFAKTPKNQIHSAVSAVMHRPMIFLIGILIGSACSVLGGYVAARLGKHDELLNGSLSSCLCIGSGIWAIATHQASGPIWQLTLGLVASPILGLLGGYLRLRQECPPLRTL